MSKINQRDPEKGAVLVFVAIIAVAIVLMIGLAIDTLRIGSAKQKQQRTAELAALAALEAYIAAPGSHEDKIEAAIYKAEKVAASDENILKTPIPGLHQAKIGALSLEETSTGQGDNVYGTMTAGRWWFSAPEDGCGTKPEPCPCLSGVFNGPCFEAFKSPPTPPTQASAFLVNLRTESSNPVKTIFAKAGKGMDSIHLHSSATASLVPRHAAFVVDMSRSIVEDSNFHDQNTFYDPADPANLAASDPNAPWPSWAAYRLTGPCTSAEEANAVLIPDSKLVRRPAKLIWVGCNAFHAPGTVPANCTWPGLKSYRPGGLEDISHHYKDDYACQGFDSDGDGSFDQWYLVEKNHVPRDVWQRGVKRTYVGPEPLSSIMGGIWQTIAVMETYSVPDDRIIFIGFDHDIIERTRVVGPTYKDDLTLDPVSGKLLFTTLKELTDISASGAENSLNLRAERGWFPRDLAGTDLPQALLAAWQNLTEMPGSESADSWTAVFSDGVSICSHGNPFMTFSEPNSFSLGVSEECNVQNPDLHAASYMEMQQISDGVYTATPGFPEQFKTFTTQGIRIHSFLFGAGIQPHNFLVDDGSGSASGRCLTDTEVRANPAWQWTADSAWSTVTNTYSYPDDAYFAPNHLFHNFLSQPGGGNFVPIRPDCGVEFSPDDYCKSQSGSEGEILSSVNSCVVAGAEAECPYPEAQKHLNNYLVRAGRVICDPGNRSTSDQINEALTKLFEDNPFLIVD